MLPFALSPQHEQAYERFFQLVNPSGAALVNGRQVYEAFTKSGLPQSTLAQIWQMSDRQKRGSLDKTDFFLALRLVAIAQQGHPLNPQSLSLQVNLPVFQGLSTSGGGAPSAEDDSVWAMSPNERAEYETHFPNADKDGDGFVSGKEAQAFFGQSKLDPQTLARIWAMSDVDGDGKLSKGEFAIAMHLVVGLRLKKPLPARLPAILAPKSSAPASAPVLTSAPSGSGSSSNLSSAGKAAAQPATDDSGDPFAGLGQESEAASSPKQPSVAPSSPIAPVLTSENSGSGPSSAAAAASAPGAGGGGFAEPPLQLRAAEPQQVPITPSDLDRINGQIEAYKQAQSDMGKKVFDRLKELKTAHEKKAEIIVTLEEKTNLCRLEQEKSAALRKQLEDLKQSLLQQQALISGKNDQVSEVKRTQQAVLAEVTVRERELQMARQDAEQKRGVLEQLKNNYSAIETVRKEQEALLRSKTAELDRLAQEKQDVADMLAEARNELARLKQNAGTIKTGHQDREQALDSLRKQLDSQKDIQRQAEEKFDITSPLVPTIVETRSAAPPQQSAPVVAPMAAASAAPYTQPQSQSHHGTKPSGMSNPFDLDFVDDPLDAFNAGKNAELGGGPAIGGTDVDLGVDDWGDVGDIDVPDVDDNLDMMLKKAGRKSIKPTQPAFDALKQMASQGGVIPQNVPPKMETHADVPPPKYEIPASSSPPPPAATAAPPPKTENKPRGPPPPARNKAAVGGAAGAPVEKEKNPFDAGFDDPFGDTSAPSGGASAAVGSDPFGGGASDPFGGPSTDPFGGGSDPFGGVSAGISAPDASSDPFNSANPNAASLASGPATSNDPFSFDAADFGGEPDFGADDDKPKKKKDGGEKKKKKKDKKKEDDFGGEGDWGEFAT